MQLWWPKQSDGKLGCARPSRCHQQKQPSSAFSQSATIHPPLTVHSTPVSNPLLKSRTMMSLSCFRALFSGCRRMVVLVAVCSAVAGAVEGKAQGLPAVDLKAQPAPHQTRNVLVVMIDGMRWEEVFRGSDPALLAAPGPKHLGDAKELAALAERKYAGANAQQRRQALMPFLWTEVATKGQIFGNRDLGSDSHVTNGLNFSYPGYAETLTGLADPRVHSNDNVPNPNPTVFTWLNQQPELQGHVAAFGAWGVFNGIFDREKCGFPVNAGWDPLTGIEPTPELTLLNKMKAETPRVWDDEPFDALPFHTAVEYLKARQPRLLFIGLGETDDWAHAGSYPFYLDAAHLADGYLAELWQLVQSLPQYKDQTTLIVLPDHGRGLGQEWTDHGEKIAAARETWMAFLGPDTPALGERNKGSQVTESQVAATIAALLGRDYRAAVPRAGLPIGDVLGK